MPWSALRQAVAGRIGSQTPRAPAIHIARDGPLPKSKAVSGAARWPGLKPRRRIISRGAVAASQRTSPSATPATTRRVLSAGRLSFAPSTMPGGQRERPVAPVRRRYTFCQALKATTCSSLPSRLGRSGCLRGCPWRRPRQATDATPDGGPLVAILPSKPGDMPTPTPACRSPVTLPPPAQKSFTQRAPFPSSAAAPPARRPLSRP